MAAKATKKPVAKVIGKDSNVFVTLGISGRALKDAGLADQSKEMYARVQACGSYDEALTIMQEYVEFR